MAARATAVTHAQRREAHSIAAFRVLSENGVAAQREHFLEELLLPPVETPPEQIVQYCMAALRDNDKPCPDAVMFINWALGGDMARTIHNGDPNRWRHGPL